MPDPLACIRAAIRSPADRVRWACVLEATAPKAGNVFPGVRFSSLDFGDFVLAADAIAPVLGSVDESTACGDLVLRAVSATRQACGTNVNLGIILLLAPLVIADSRRVCHRVPLQEAVAEVLQALTTEDARDVYAAIREAQPGGMGEAAEMDVHTSAPEDLLAAMRAAANRDRVARQYAQNFRDLLSSAIVGCLAQAIHETGDVLSGIQRAQLVLLAAQVDSLIARKCGQAVAEEASQRAQDVLDANNFSQAWRAYDAWLRADGHRRNPGTTADLITAGMWVLLGENPSPVP